MAAINANNKQAMRARCRIIAAENSNTITPKIIQELPNLRPAMAEKINLNALAPLNPADCPRFILSAANYPELPDIVANSRAHLAYPATTALPDQRWYGTMLKVINQDTFDCAMSLPSAIFGLTTADKNADRLERKMLRRLQNVCGQPDKLQQIAGRVAVMNFANESNPGGGWTNGALAQEEYLCYRSTLGASLLQTHYPWQPREGLYTQDVVIYREAIGYTPPDFGHRLLPQTSYIGGAENLPVVSALSVAAIFRPRTHRGSNNPNNTYYSNPSHRELTKDKIRLTLRMAARKGHTIIVLGAFGCGAFANPPTGVCHCFTEVLQEPEFQGGWFKEIWFAVLDPQREGNYPIFRDHMTREAYMVSDKVPAP
ncbi:hypothetical protein QBC43DRAFT_328089 [Cladorrhinum sp. PSN259]|nr:hypothetical protein QBC43DRAFT_328089 [Cladorrhinum sp. PSN259]